MGEVQYGNDALDALRARVGLAAAYELAFASAKRAKGAIKEGSETTHAAACVLESMARFLIVTRLELSNKSVALLEDKVLEYALQLGELDRPPEILDPHFDQISLQSLYLEPPARGAGGAHSL